MLDELDEECQEEDMTQRIGECRRSTPPRGLRVAAVLRPDGYADPRPGGEDRRWGVRGFLGIEREEMGILIYVSWGSLVVCLASWLTASSDGRRRSVIKLKMDKLESV